MTLIYAGLGLAVVGVLLLAYGLYRRCVAERCPHCGREAECIYDVGGVADYACQCGHWWQGPGVSPQPGGGR